MYKLKETNWRKRWPVYLLHFICRCAVFVNVVVNAVVVACLLVTANPWNVVNRNAISFSIHCPLWLCIRVSKYRHNLFQYPKQPLLSGRYSNYCCRWLTSICRTVCCWRCRCVNVEVAVTASREWRVCVNTGVAEKCTTLCPGNKRQKLCDQVNALWTL